jgi:HNH endonuclease
MHLVKVGAPQIRCAPVKRCIYCGNVSNLLTDEHIIPDGIGGNLILPEASCQACATAIMDFEPIIINHQYRAARGILNIRSKKRGKKRKPLTLEYIPDGSDNVVEYEASPDAPFGIAVPIILDRPGMLLQYPPDHLIGWGAHQFFQPDRLGERGAPTGMIHQGRFWRFLAKIAHGYSVSCLGFDHFKPYLRSYIRFPNACDIDGYFFDRTHMTHYIGNAPEEEWITGKSLHTISLQEGIVRVWAAPPSGYSFRRIAIVHVQLFTNLGLPVYELVTGEVSGPWRQLD